MAVAHRCELRLADRFGTASGVTLAGATNISFSVGLGGGGFLSAEVDARAEPVASNPNILDDCVVRLAIPLDGTDTPTEVLAYAPRARSGILFEEGGGKTAQISNAPTLWQAWSQDSVLYTEANDLPQMAAPLDGQRFFGYQSSNYSFAADSAFAWSGDPNTTVGAQSTTSGDRASDPDGWPAALGHAIWITRPTGTSAALSRHLFVRDVAIPADGYCQILFSADESCAVYWAGALVIHTSASETGYKEVSQWSAWVTAGTYRIAVDKTSIAQRGGDGYDPILCAIVTLTNNGSIDDILVVTDASWYVYALDPVDGVTPALTPGQILLELHGQAAARGVNTMAAVTPTFTAAADSLAVPWGVREERAWRVGHDRMLDMVEGLGDMGLDIEISPQAGTLNLNAYYERGTDLSGSVGVTAINPAAPVPGLDSVDSIVESGAGVVATVLEVETQAGWIAGGLSNAAALAAYGRREASLSLGNAPSIAQGKRLGQKVLDERLSRPTTEWSVEYYSTGVVASGASPFRDFNLGDTITVNIGGVGTPRVVLEIGGQAESVNAIIRWTLKTGPVLT